MPTTTRAKHFIDALQTAALFAAAIAAAVAIVLLTPVPKAHAEGWKVDFSRRTQEVRGADLRAPASVTGTAEMPITAPPVNAQAPTPGFFESLFQPTDVAQEIVILQTEKGFVPSSINLRKGMNYQIHVVNVNEKEKNVSFVLDSFSEHHATYYGQIKTFVIRPQKEGVYRFNSPETSAMGKVVVIPSGGAENRAPASE